MKRKEWEKMSFNIAIDGPAGAGKSTIAKKVAEKIGFIYVDTGAMYRAIALYFLKHQISIEDEKRVQQACQEIQISITYTNNEQQVLLNGENVTTQLRAEAVGNMASIVAANADVRVALLELQRNLARSADSLMDGRDIGTNVLPKAQLKIYLTAAVSTRAKRRHLELLEKGVKSRIEEVEMDIKQRDYQDMNRSVAPLRQAADAVLVDSSSLGIDEVVEHIINLYQQRSGKSR